MGGGIPEGTPTSTERFTAKKDWFWARKLYGWMGADKIDSMNSKLIAEASTTIKAPASKVWDALINPKLVKQYFYGTEVVSDWKVGSKIAFKGEWEGKPYEDKGKILVFDPEKKLQYTYLSSFSGLPDKPENYGIVTFDLKTKDDSTQVTLSQSNFEDEAARLQSVENWKGVLGELKKFLEG